MDEELRCKVASKAGTDHVSPADCKKIANDIFKVTRKRVSETTLKRFFGFTSSKFEFSRYTISTLNEYVESECSVTISTQINVQKPDKKKPMEIRFDLEDGYLKLGECIGETIIDNLQESGAKDLPIRIKLNKKQIKALLKDIKSAEEH